MPREGNSNCETRDCVALAALIEQQRKRQQECAQLRRSDVVETNFREHWLVAATAEAEALASGLVCSRAAPNIFSHVPFCLPPRFFRRALFQVRPPIGPESALEFRANIDSCSGGPLLPQLERALYWLLAKLVVAVEPHKRSGEWRASGFAKCVVHAHLKQNRKANGLSFIGRQFNI